MNIGKFNERVSLMIPQFTTSDYGRIEVDGYIYHERWAEVNRKHSKKFAMRYADGSAYEGILTIRKENKLLASTRVSIDGTEYDIDSIIPTDNKTYYEIVYKEAVQ